MPKQPCADELRQAAQVLRRVLELTQDGTLADHGARGTVRRIEGAAIGLEAAAEAR